MNQDEQSKVIELVERLRKHERAAAWLIEIPERGDSYEGGKRVGPAVPLQYYGGGKIRDRDGYLTRTADVNEAVRFARKQDAESMIVRLGIQGGRAVDHEWIGYADEAAEIFVYDFLVDKGISPKDASPSAKAIVDHLRSRNLLARLSPLPLVEDKS
jgi:hypothetical protein